MTEWMNILIVATGFFGGFLGLAFLLNRIGPDEPESYDDWLDRQW